MDRTDEIRLPEDTTWLIDPHAQAVCRAVMDGGHRIFFVGGCVRNALLGLSDSDVDMSTDALPERVMALAKAAGLKVVPTGIDHGTVTVISGPAAFEVTTFRRDVATDGRRAVVAFSDNIEDDARRRDFTINALYASIQGRVLDPLGGLPDLKARRIRFIEDANARIREDYLRILRFFRFSAWYGDPHCGFDNDAMDAIARNIDGLETLSAERVGQEMQKLLTAPDPAASVAGMRVTSTLTAILPGADDRWVAVLVHMENVLGIAPRWLRRLAILGGEDPKTRLRFSRKDARIYSLLRDLAVDPSTPAEIAYRHGADIAADVVLIRAAMSETTPENGLLETISHASGAKFPISAEDLMPDLFGPALRERLTELERIWIHSGFVLKKSELLNHP